MLLLLEENAIGGDFDGPILYFHRGVGVVRFLTDIKNSKRLDCGIGRRAVAKKCARAIRIRPISS